MRNVPVWALENGGANMDYAVYVARVNLDEKGLIPVSVNTGMWRAAMLTVAKENAWTTAVVELKWQASPMTARYSFSTPATITSATSPPATAVIDITAIPFLTAEITTAEGSDAFAEFRLCLYKWS